MNEAFEGSPFRLENKAAYQRWREQKLSGYPKTLEALLVEVDDPVALTPHERQGLIERVTKCNMALFRLSGTHIERGEEGMLALMAQLGCRRVDHNLGARGGFSSLTPGGEADQRLAGYIPYTPRAIGWHTDGYYNASGRQIHALALYCERPALQGGENRLWDHELAYMRLRDENPDMVRALMAPDVMTIPPRMEGEQIARAERVGPVFSIDPQDGHLHMRYTHRTISIAWKQDPISLEAVSALRGLFDEPGPFIFEGRLEAGWGLVSNNVLHTRGAFQDDGGESGGRRMFRARFYDRVA
ncbi:MAG: TauD/TfdA family dioxygenase [Magnetococcales bacterium]|nr:TauD/TfdA family dioxygenase [Magnetococcales bacterium]